MSWKTQTECPKNYAMTAAYINIKMLIQTQNKKSELMLMRRARAYSSSCSQVILVYLHPFCRKSLFCSQKSQKNH